MHHLHHGPETCRPQRGALVGGHVLPQGHRATKMSRPTTSPGRVGGREQPTSESARQPGTLKGQPVSGQTHGGLSPASLPALPSHCTTCRSESLFHVLASSGQPSQDSPHATTWTLLPQMRVLSRACTPLYKVLSCTSMQAAGTCLHPHNGVRCNLHGLHTMTRANGKGQQYNRN